MPSSSSSGGQSGQKRAQGAGRKSNNEPRLQLFKDFSGINFELSSRGYAGAPVDVEATNERDQSDLQMNFMYIQNNVRMTSNKTLSTRNDIIHLFTVPYGTLLSGAAIVLGQAIYLGEYGGDLFIDALPETGEPFRYPTILSHRVNLNSLTGSGHHWQSFAQFDNKLIGLTGEHEIWTGEMIGPGAVAQMQNARRIPDPADWPLSIEPHGDLTFEDSWTDECTFRIRVKFTFVNKFGPTMPSDEHLFYANRPVTEWNSEQYATIKGRVMAGYQSEVDAVEFYYCTDNAEEYIFLGRTDTSHFDGGFEYNWYGYSDATNMWPIANLTIPTENYTKGAPASHAKVVDGRIYMWDQQVNPSRLYIGGNPGNLLSVSPGTGGGFVDIEPGTGQGISSVHKYKTQSGNSIVTILTHAQNTNREQRFNLVENNISLSNEQNMKSWQAEQVAGAVGCQSTYGALVCEDGLYTVNRYGLALTTMTMEYNSQIRVNYVSDAIKPIFTDTSMGRRLKTAKLLNCDGILYLAMGTGSEHELDNVLFCYDVANKAWWTYTIDINEPILNLVHIDYVQGREGIGIITPRNVYLLPTTEDDESDEMSTYEFLIETGKLSTQMPQQSWQYLSQLEFRFDHFYGTMTIRLRAKDMFGRDIEVVKTVTEREPQYDYVVHMRVDLKLMSYVLSFSGRARFRMSHWLARVYTMSDRIGQVWGFDDRISYRQAGDVHPTFKCYNDVRKAIFT